MSKTLKQLSTELKKAAKASPLAVELQRQIDNRRKNRREYYLANKERLKEIYKSARSTYLREPANHHKFKVRMALNNAVRRGKMYKLSCEVCGDENSQAHHDNYSKPLKVRWLCRQHHQELHNK